MTFGWNFGSTVEITIIINLTKPQCAHPFGNNGKIWKVHRGDVIILVVAATVWGRAPHVATTALQVIVGRKPLRNIVYSRPTGGNVRNGNRRRRR